MKQFILICMLLQPFAGFAASPHRQNQNTASIEVKVDPRVTLLSIIFRLAGNPEYNQPNSASPYSKKVEEVFGKFRAHAVVKRARSLRAQRGVSYDAVMSMAMHISDTASLKELIPFDKHPERLDRRWPLEEARLFLKEARDFARKSRFNTFFRIHRTLYAETERRMKKVLAERTYVSWFDSFFGKRRGARFVLSPGLLLGGCCYGTGIRFPDGKETIHPVIGVWKFDAKGIPVIPSSIAGTVAHELCHSYTNPIVDRHEELLRDAGGKIYATCSETMKNMAYGTWKTMIYESLVRACVVRYLAATGGDVEAQRETAAQHQKGFLWTGELAALLKTYESSRDRYTTFDAFVPKIAAFFSDYAEKAVKLEKRKPKVLSITPANGSTNVDPALTRITITFDRQMINGSWSVVGGGPHFPKIAGKVYYEKDLKTFVMPVTLKPNWTYYFWLNRGTYNSFRSKAGVPLASVKVTFTTGPEK